eukprot:760129-Hanusia_phi.AAC.3
MPAAGGRGGREEEGPARPRGPQQQARAGGWAGSKRVYPWRSSGIPEGRSGGGGGNAGRGGERRGREGGAQKTLNSVKASLRFLFGSNSLTPCRFMGVLSSPKTNTSPSSGRISLFSSGSTCFDISSSSCTSDDMPAPMNRIPFLRPKPGEDAVTKEEDGGFGSKHPPHPPEVLFCRYGDHVGSGKRHELGPSSVQFVPVGWLVKLGAVGSHELIGDDEQLGVPRAWALAEEGNPLLGDAPSGGEAEKAILHQYHVELTQLEKERRDVGAADAADGPGPCSPMALGDVVAVIGSAVPRDDMHKEAVLPQRIDNHPPAIGTGADARDGRPLGEEQELRRAVLSLDRSRRPPAVRLGASPCLVLVRLLLPACGVGSNREHAVAEAAHLPSISVGQVDLEAVEPWEEVQALHLQLGAVIRGSAEAAACSVGSRRIPSSSHR